MKNFVHVPIYDNEIRLLWVHRDKVGGSSHLNLRHYKLDEAPDYVALSYCWGTSEKTEDWYCEHEHENGFLKLTSNLSHILNLIAVQNFSNDHPLWIDQICIDQENNVEKVSQIKLMGGIYASATTTLIHLGPDIEREDALYPFLLRFAWLAKKNYGLAGEKQASVIWHRAYYHIRYLFPSKWIAMAGLFDKPWFERLWTVQECILSKSPMVICGNNLINWHDLRLGITRASLQLQRSVRWTSQLSKALVTLQLESSHLDLDSSFTYNNSQPQRYKILDALDTYGHRECRDPRDKIFAVLGIATDAEPLANLIDYEGPAEMTIVRVMRKLTGVDDNNRYGVLPMLDLVDPASLDRPQRGLPSWVPDFAAHKSFRRAIDEGDFGQEYEDLPNDAIAQIAETALFRLRVRGIYIGTLTTLHREDDDDSIPENYVGPSAMRYRAYLEDEDVRCQWRTDTESIVKVHFGACDAGDQIFVFPGLERPVVLRQYYIQNTYRFRSLVMWVDFGDVHPQHPTKERKWQKTNTWEEAKTKHVAWKKYGAGMSYRPAWDDIWMQYEEDCRSGGHAKERPFIEQELILI